ncbi:hypothetical protein CTA1_8596 [Colletotrichum tanaceti]|uniref:Zn(2)-C6 fungal-type domain-containing protein n=1 Tax=Colletotrichum tanaceti TaxID=1306861 RepID=A0A4U6X123_9PEZI|nr:hypothetical protein CTA1_8596 [Colletotrichum tanaceti]
MYPIRRFKAHRKVKCDESRPQCSHCERLNLECKWQPQSGITAARPMPAAPGSSGPGRSPAVPSHANDASVSPAASVVQPLQAVDEIFDYASFMWDAGDA